MAQDEKAKEPTVTFQAKGGLLTDPKPMEVHAGVGDIKPWDADSWAQFEQVGKPRPRAEGPLKVTGRATYTYDVKLPGMLYGRMIGAAIPAGEIVSIDTSKAEALPGVKAVWTTESRVVRFAGQDVAAVAAVSPEIAMDAARLVKVTYKESPFIHELREAMKDGAPLVYDLDKSPAGPDVPRKGNVFGPGRGRGRGDVEKGFAEAEVVHEGTYYCPVHTHSPLETHGVVASWEGDQLTVYASTQGIFAVREGLAEALGIDRKNVRVDLRAHGRRLRQQARPLGERQRLRHGGLPAREEGRGAGQADARPQAAAPVHRQRPERAHDGEGRGEEGRHPDRRPLQVLRARPASPAAPGRRGRRARSTARTRTSRPRSTTSSRTRARRRRCAPPATRRAPSASSRRWTSSPRSSGIDPLELRKKNEASPVRLAQYDLGAKEIGWAAPQQEGRRHVDRRLGRSRPRRSVPTRSQEARDRHGERQLVRVRRRGLERPGEGPPRRLGRGDHRLPGHRHRLPHRDDGGGGRGARDRARGRHHAPRRHPVPRGPGLRRQRDHQLDGPGRAPRREPGPDEALRPRGAAARRRARGARRREREDLRGEGPGRRRSPSSRPRRR